MQAEHFPAPFFMDLSVQIDLALVVQFISPLIFCVRGPINLTRFGAVKIWTFRGPAHSSSARTEALLIVCGGGTDRSALLFWSSRHDEPLHIAFKVLVRLPKSPSPPSFPPSLPPAIPHCVLLDISFVMTHSQSQFQEGEREGEREREEALEALRQECARPALKNRLVL